MARYVASVRTDRQPEEVFDLMADMRNAPGWDPNVKSVTKTSDGDVGPGTVFAVAVAVGPRTMTLPYRVAAFERPGRVVLEARTSTLHSRDTVTVEPEAEGGCTVTYDAELSGRGVGALAGPLLGPALRRIGDAAADGLRRRLGAA
jgi:uncharacterized protein YndB with AHSA1/START domain